MPPRRCSTFMCPQHQTRTGESRGEHEITTCACLCSVYVYEEDRKGRRMGGWTEAGIEQEVKMQKEKQ